MLLAPRQHCATGPGQSIMPSVLRRRPASSVFKTSEPGLLAKHASMPWLFARKPWSASNSLLHTTREVMVTRHRRAAAAGAALVLGLTHGSTSPLDQTVYSLPLPVAVLTGLTLWV